MSQNAKQSSLQLRRLATPPFFALAVCAAAVWVAWVASVLFGVLSVFLKVGCFTWPAMAVTGRR